MNPRRRCLCPWLVIVAVLSASTASAATYTVNSIADLQARIDAAIPGDTIVVQNGVYTTSATIAVTSAGTATDRITIAAETPGGVEITGTHGFSVTSPAAYVTIDGFVLEHASGRNSIGWGAFHVRFTRNAFESTGNGAYLTVAGDDAEVDRNEFRNKSTVGNMLDVRGAGFGVLERNLFVRWRERAHLHQVELEYDSLQHDYRLAWHAADASARERQPGLR